MKSISTFLSKVYSKWPVLLYDTLAIPIAWFGSYWLRYNLQPFYNQLDFFESLATISIIMVIQLTMFYVFRVYRGLWRFASMGDAVRIIQSIAATIVIATPILYFLSLLHYIPRSVPPLYSMILMTFLCAGRFGFRYCWEWYYREEDEALKMRVLVIGAGRAGESLVRDLKRLSNYDVIGFIDDNPSKMGLEIHGVRVIGNTSKLVDIATILHVDLIFIAIPSLRSKEMRKILTICEPLHIPIRTLPSINMLVAGRVEVNALREVNIEDLLGREPVNLAWDKISDLIANHAVMITGAGGSIGSELCRQVISLQPSHLILVDHSEYLLYTIEQELRERFPTQRITACLLSVTDKKAVEQCFTMHHPEMVFHAAAYKHVPMLQSQLRIAMLNNVIGTEIVAKQAVASRVKKFVLISTDKAVNPTNVMGATKRLAEVLCQNLNERTDTQFITVRFGNVLNSAGSVVPLFKKQIQAGGPVTVTHPEMTRYFMTIPEACQLILQATVNGGGGEIFVLDMGEPVKISYLAEQMIRLAGKEPNKDINIEYIGLRPGEKLYEELFHPQEQLNQTEHEKLFKASFRAVSWEELEQTFALIQSACNIGNTEELFILMQSLVPEYRCQKEDSFAV